MASRKHKNEENDELATLERIEVLVAAIARAALAAPLSEIMGHSKFRLLYEKAGSIARPELERRTGFSGGKISGLWKQWEAKGLMIKDGKSYRPIL
jgi:hypothetical protein